MHMLSLEWTARSEPALLMQTQPCRIRGHPISMAKYRIFSSQRAIVCPMLLNSNTAALAKVWPVCIRVAV